MDYQNRFKEYTPPWKTSRMSFSIYSHFEQCICYTFTVGELGRIYFLSWISDIQVWFLLTKRVFILKFTPYNAKTSQTNYSKTKEGTHGRGKYFALIIE